MNEKDEPHDHVYGQWREGPNYPQMNRGKEPLGYTIIHRTQVRTCQLCGANQLKEV